ncbi:MAG: SOS response-associated peptidase [Armatimonadetes bacterium]|nr:SOS response-associated peptidase [Armatimonadota bacterium]MDE2206470.1 SOS response-associated peptidase [Armatimonadota bacterium]
MLRDLVAWYPLAVALLAVRRLLYCGALRQRLPAILPDACAEEAGMCGRFVLFTPADVIAAEFQASPIPRLTARYNIAPSSTILMVREVGGHNILEPARWGVVPAWLRERAGASQLINARSETAAEKPTFAAAFRQRRCIVPADGFYEWQKLDSRKQPFYFSKAEGGLLSLAGLWEAPQTQGEPPCCVILTTDANELMRPVHNRMPVVLTRQARSIWLDTGITDTDALMPLLAPASDGVLTKWPVGARIGRASEEGSDLLSRVGR